MSRVAMRGMLLAVALQLPISDAMGATTALQGAASRAGCDSTDLSSNPETLIVARDTLESIAVSRYGHRAYARLIELHNSLPSATALRPGTRLATPDRRRLLREASGDPTTATAVDALYCAQAAYGRIRSALAAISRSRQRPESSQTPLPDHVTGQLMEIAGRLRSAAAALRDRPSGQSTPTHTVGQLEQAQHIVEQLSKRQFDGYGYDIDLVDQHLAQAMTNFVLWARAGYL